MITLELSAEEAEDLRCGLEGWIDIPDFWTNEGDLKVDAPPEIRNLFNIIQRLKEIQKRAVKV